MANTSLAAVDDRAVRDLERLVAERAGVEARIVARVFAAREDNVSWLKIGRALGISPQAAHQRFTRLGAPKVKS